MRWPAVILATAALAAVFAGSAAAWPAGFPPLPAHTNWCGQADGTDPLWAAVPCQSGISFFECTDGTVWATGPDHLDWWTSGNQARVYPACTHYLKLTPTGPVLGALLAASPAAATVYVVPAMPAPTAVLLGPGSGVVESPPVDAVRPARYLRVVT